MSSTPDPRTLPRQYRRPHRHALRRRTAATAALSALASALATTTIGIAGPVPAATAAPAAASASASASASAITLPTSAVFATAGVTSTWTVPDGVTKVHVHAVGGSGADGFGFSTVPGGRGGNGGTIDADLAVVTGQVLAITPGAAGTTIAPGSGRAPGGATGGTYLSCNPFGFALAGGNGGAATWIERAGQQLLSAGGGGGGGGASQVLLNRAAGGNGGNGLAQPGASGTGPMGGAGGTGSSLAANGGRGGNARVLSCAGGGGGGGGGAAGNGGGAGGAAGTSILLTGGAGGGGAGGATWAADPSAISSVATTKGNGSVSLSWSYSPTVVADTTTVDFGTQPAGRTTTKSLTLRNVGTVTEPLTLAGVTGDFALASSSTCGSTLSPGSRCTYDISFAPTASSSSAQLTVSGPPVPLTVALKGASAPMISGLSVSSGDPAGGDTTVITGSGFLNVQSVTFGGKAATINSCSAVSCEVVTPPGVDGTGASVVVNTAIGTTNAVTYQYKNPAITALPSPVRGPDAGGTVVTFTGQSLGQVTAVTFDDVPAASILSVSPATVVVTTPTHPAAFSTPKFTTKSGFHFAASTGSFEFKPGTPSVTQLNPASGPVVGGNKVTITGVDLYNISSIMFGSTPASFGCLNTVCTATVPPGSGSVLVTASSPLFTGTVGVTYTYDLPSANTATPPHGPDLGANAVVLGGLNLSSVKSVTVGGLPASFIPSSDTSIKVIMPPHGTGTVSIVLTTVTGEQATATATYTYDPPSASSMTAFAGPINGGTKLTVKGANFTGVTKVSLAGVPATSYSCSDSECDVTTGPSTTRTTGTLVMTTADGDTMTGLPFTYYAAPALDGFDPYAGGSTAGGEQVFVVMRDPYDIKSITFGGKAAVIGSCDVNGCTVTTPPADAPGPVDVVATNPAGTSNAITFTYVDPLSS